MNQIQIGKLIAKARKEKGYTQKSLADLLFVTDKAVSKWERGLSFPDTSIIYKLSNFLEIDIETLIEEELKQDEWIGVLKVNETNNIYKEKIGGQSVLLHLCSLFLLLGITKIYIHCNDEKFVEDTVFEMKNCVNFAHDLLVRIDKAYDQSQIITSLDNKTFINSLESNPLKSFLSKSQLKENDSSGPKTHMTNSDVSKSVDFTKELLGDTKISSFLSNTNASKKEDLKGICFYLTNYSQVGKLADEFVLNNGLEKIIQIIQIECHLIEVVNIVKILDTITAIEKEMKMM